MSNPSPVQALKLSPRTLPVSSVARSAYCASPVDDEIESRSEPAPSQEAEISSPFAETIARCRRARGGAVVDGRERRSGHAAGGVGMSRGVGAPGRVGMSRRRDLARQIRIGVLGEIGRDDRVILDLAARDGALRKLDRADGAGLELLRAHAVLGQCSSGIGSAAECDGEREACNDERGRRKTARHEELQDGWVWVRSRSGAERTVTLSMSRKPAAREEVVRSRPRAIAAAAARSEPRVSDALCRPSIERTACSGPARGQS